MIIHRETDILRWATDRNIIGENAQATIAGQFRKTLEEWAEWDRDRNQDAIGDTVVTLILLTELCGRQLGTLSDTVDLPKEHPQATMNSLFEAVSSGTHEDIAHRAAGMLHQLDKIAQEQTWSLEQCIEVAWNEIKERKGMMLHGVFVKQSDLDLLAADSIRPVGARLEIVVDSADGRTAAISKLCSHGWNCDSKFSECRWTVFSTEKSE
ncbi:MAG: hypothetical protein IBX50_20390 [Marinospirillum sp.]|uniref:hypothetical protein n=1 Tax=Marinospirillum sp. TaxID=2183934 RepID=UPI001A0A35F3|nr:hypothetical protein [Marinospirillum sp.]MBE0509044.1 hypothetical protein [Marinospirillum sp.]